MINKTICSNKFSQKISKLSQNSIKKSKFCSLVSELLKSNNNKTIKKPIIDAITNYLSITEQLSSRVVCKQWDEVLRKKIPCLKKENLYKKTKDTDNIFDNSDQKFSKKNVLVRMISSKQYTLIKKRTSLEGIIKSKNLTM